MPEGARAAEPRFRAESWGSNKAHSHRAEDRLGPTRETSRCEVKSRRDNVQHSECGQ